MIAQLIIILLATSIKLKSSSLIKSKDLDTDGEFHYLQTLMDSFDSQLKEPYTDYLDIFNKLRGISGKWNKFQAHMKRYSTHSEAQQIDLMSFKKNIQNRQDNLYRLTANHIMHSYSMTDKEEWTLTNIVSYFINKAMYILKWLNVRLDYDDYLFIENDLDKVDELYDLCDGYMEALLNPVLGDKFADLKDEITMFEKRFEEAIAASNEDDEDIPSANKNVDSSSKVEEKVAPIDSAPKIETPQSNK